MDFAEVRLGDCAGVTNGEWFARNRLSDRTPYVDDGVAGLGELPSFARWSNVVAKHFGGAGVGLV